MPLERRQLKYASVDELLADLARLRDSDCDRCGNWSLPQACWHLHTTTQYVMQPGPYPDDTPEQIAARPLMHRVLNEGMPPGIEAPAGVVPPPDAPATAVDDFVATVRKFAAFPGPFGPHRRFGNVGDDVIRRLVLAHSAHHLSHFVPKNGR
jgi:Protein of unknown function (DUF1569)